MATEKTKKVKLMYPLAGPGIGAFEAGAVVALPVSLADELLNTNQAVDPSAETAVQPDDFEPGDVGPEKKGGKK